MNLVCDLRRFGCAAAWPYQEDAEDAQGSTERSAITIETNAKTMMIKSTKAAGQAKDNTCVGSSVDEFFASDGLLLEIEAAAMKRVIAQAQITEVNAKHISQN